MTRVAGYAFVPELPNLNQRQAKGRRKYRQPQIVRKVFG
jgi:hypothetical protein